MRLNQFDLHGLSFVDAALVGLAFMDKAYPEKVKRMREYQKMAKAVGIPIEEDPELVRQRHREQMAQVEADFG